MVFWSGFIKKIKNAVTKERVDKLEQKINTNAANIELVEQDVETNTTNIGTIRNEMIMLKQEDNNIKRRLEQAETNITQTNNELDSLEARVNGYDARITEANTKATSAEEQATRLGLTVSNNSTKIVALETKNTELTNKVNTNTSNISSLKGTVDGIIKLKYQSVDISKFTNDNSYNASGGRNQTYRYPIPNITLSRIVSITGIAVFADNNYPGSTVSYSTGTFSDVNHVLINIFVNGANSSFPVTGKIYIWYY